MRTCVLTLALILCAAAAFAATSLTSEIQRQYDGLKGFKAEFKQQLKNGASGEVETRVGRLAFKQPGLIRWETDSPEPELLLVGKDVVWNYFSKEKTAIKYQVQSVLNSKTMLRFISGKARLDEDFAVEDQGSEAGLTKLKLTPKEPEPNMVLAYVWVDPASKLLKSILIIDFYGNANKLGLDQLTVNPDLPESLFTFTPPAGVEVKDNTKGDAQISPN